MHTALHTPPALLKKYNVPVPRYTSYPTVPYWQQEPVRLEAWGSHVQAALSRSREMSLYVHLPFCENLCTYCGCNTRITKQHAVELPYIETLLQEWALYREIFPVKPLLRELHLGGGTPTFFSPENLKKLIQALLQAVEVSKEKEFSFEAHPSSTTREHLQVLYDLGFRRVSIGVQDFDPHILQLINRQQTEAQVRQVAQWAREIGYHSVNFDIIFGLPTQTVGHIEATMLKIKELRPDRIAFYSYAHVPWIKPGQRAYSEADLPSDVEKRKLYERGRYLLEEEGYTEIGMDHFALPKDGLYRAMQAGRLHRNFMGYTPLKTELLLGLGASSISDAWTGFVQNEKQVEAYQQAVKAGQFPIMRGHELTPEDLVLRQHILNIICHLETEWLPENTLFAGIKSRLQPLAEDGLIELGDHSLRVTDTGRPFLRNICTAFDARLWRKQPETRLFSQGV